MIETVPYLNKKFKKYSKDSEILVPIQEKIQVISDKNIKEIHNILGHDERLFDTFLNIIKHGGASLSENIGNDFEVESELKVLEVVKKELIKDLELFEFEKTFDGNIDDIYLDFLQTPEKMLSNDKVTVRIRFKTFKDNNGKKNLKILCTLKKRIRDEDNNKEENQDGLEFRECFEKEFVIHDLRYVLKQLDSLELYPYRQKFKQRVSYITRKQGTKFDIDTYKGIPTLMEIESIRNLEDILKFMRALGLSKNKTSSKGSRGLFEMYGVLYDYIQESKEIIP